MKLKYILTSLVAVCALAIGCTKQNQVTQFDEIKVSQSIVAVGDTPCKVEVTAAADWKVEDVTIPSWVKISPLNGPAGTTTMVFEKGEPTDKLYESVNLVLTCGGKSLTMLVQIGEPAPLNDINSAWTADEAIAYYKVNGGGAQFYVKGVVTKASIDLGYGNAEFYLEESDPDYNFEFYRCMDIDNKKFTKADKVKAGDTIIGFGQLTEYKGTVEFAQGCYLVKITPSEIELANLADVATPAPKEGGVVTAKLIVKGSNFRFEIGENSDWLSIKSIDAIPAEYDERGRELSPAMSAVNVSCAPNNGGAREGTIDFISGESKITVSFSQEGAIAEVTVAEFLAAEEGTAQYKVSGFITNRTDLSGHKFDLTTYGNFDLVDASGNAYVYGVGSKGDIATYGVKEGDIITLVGQRSSFNGAPQMKGGQYVSHKSVTAVTAAQVAGLADDDEADPKNYIRLTGKVSNIANTTYGNFDLVDETGSIYIYGLSTGWNGETKKFAELGIKEGDILTLVGYKTSFNGNAQVVGMYVSHEKGPELSLAQTSWLMDDGFGGGSYFSFVDEKTVYNINAYEGEIFWEDMISFPYTLDVATQTVSIITGEDWLGTLVFTINETQDKLIAQSAGWEGAEFVKVDYLDPTKPAELVYSLETANAPDGSNSSYAGNCDIEVDGIVWNLQGNSTMHPWRIGGKSLEGEDRTVYTKTAWSTTLSKIVVAFGLMNDITVNSATLVYSTKEDFSEATELPFTPAATSEIEIIPEGGFPANCYYKFVFNVTVTATSNKYIQFNGVEFYK